MTRPEHVRSEACVNAVYIFNGEDQNCRPPPETASLPLIGRTTSLAKSKGSKGGSAGDLRVANLSENTVKTYAERSERFLRCLTGD